MPVQVAHSPTVPVIRKDLGSGVAVFPTPLDIAVDGCERVSLLPRGAHWGHHMHQPLALTDGAHRGEQLLGKATGAAISRVAPCRGRVAAAAKASTYSPVCPSMLSRSKSRWPQ